MNRCNHPMRTGSCDLDPGHRGKHTTVAFYCDACGKRRRSTPFVVGKDSNGDPDVAICFMCAVIEADSH